MTQIPPPPPPDPDEHPAPPPPPGVTPPDSPDTSDESSAPGGFKTPTPLWVTVVVAVVCLALGAIGGGALNMSTIDDLEAENDELVTKVSALEDDLTGAEDAAAEARDDASANAADAEEAADLAEERDELAARVDDLEGEVASLTTERDDLRAQLDVQLAEATPPPTLHYEGTGDTVINVDPPINGGEFTLAHSGSSNFAIWALDASGGDIDLIVNEIGNYNGTTVAGDSFGSTPIAKLEVTADGYWTIDVVVLD